jgi:hypothetical protein
MVKHLLGFLILCWTRNRGLRKVIRSIPAYPPIVSRLQEISMNRTSLVKIIILGAAYALLTACSTPSEAVNLNDNSKGYRITCGGAYSSVNDCYERAGYLCGSKGYSTVHEEDITPPADANYFWNAAAHELVVRCNTPR